MFGSDVGGEAKIPVNPDGGDKVGVLMVTTLLVIMQMHINRYMRLMTMWMKIARK